MAGSRKRQKGANMEWYELDAALYGVAKHWGDQMPMMAMEELAELSQAISKYKREPTAERKEAVRREMADVIIATEALSRAWELGTETVNEYVYEKLSKKY
jgi:NTP pyrophosphatase (non-canonical NTP hydrolase)